VTALLTALLAWQHPWSSQQAGGGGMPGPGGPNDGPNAVSVTTIANGDMPETVSGLGTVTPLASIIVRSQLSGYLTAVAFREGQMVHKGDVLATIDPRLYQAALVQYREQLQRDQALLHNAQLDLARYQKLTTQDSISRQTTDTAASTVRQYEGTVKYDQGLVDTQQVNLDYCRITAPADGRLGLRQVDAGNYVTPSDTNGIVMLTQLQPISVLFTLPETNLPAVMRRLQAGAKLPVTAMDRANQTALANGVLDAVDNQVETTTGTVNLRALFPNDDSGLFPNQFVNALLLVDTVRSAPLVPVAAIQTGDGDGSHVIVSSGLKTGDRVIVDGADRLKDGATVTVPIP
jgi:multidrug efflux system membrane fusion protein